VKKFRDQALVLDNDHPPAAGIFAGAAGRGLNQWCSLCSWNLFRMHAARRGSR
jgi:hypothetical protein